MDFILWPKPLKKILCYESCKLWILKITLKHSLGIKETGSNICFYGAKNFIQPFLQQAVASIQLNPRNSGVWHGWPLNGPSVKIFRALSSH